MFSQNIMLSVCVLCFSVNAALFTFPMMLLISYWLMIDDVITGGRSLILRFLQGPGDMGPGEDAPAGNAGAAIVYGGSISLILVIPPPQDKHH